MKIGNTFSSILTNAFAFLAPLLIGVFALPVIIDQLGMVRFGFLSVGWVIIGYFSVFDLGLGRALTQAISSRLGANSPQGITSMTTKVLCVMFALALLGSLLLVACSSILIAHVLKVPIEMQSESRTTIYLLAAGIPAVVLYSGLRGILEALGNFHTAAASRTMLGTWTFISPLLIFPWTKSLVWIVLALVLGRYVVAAIMGVFCYLNFKRRGLLQYSGPADLSGILVFGGWMTVSNLISPIMVYMDRFFVTSLAGLHVVGYYTAPYDLVSRLTFIPEAVFSVLFPAMARNHATDPRTVAKIYDGSLRGLACAMAPICVFIVAFSPDLLSVWLGDGFSQHSYIILDILAVGLFFNVMARPSYNLLQAKGRSDLTAKIHLFELPLYVPILVFLVSQFGVTGAAWAWLARACVDFYLMTVFAHFNAANCRGSIRVISIYSIVAILILCGAFIDFLLYRLIYFSIIISILFLAFYILLLSRFERKYIIGMILFKFRH